MGSFGLGSKDQENWRQASVGNVKQRKIKENHVFNQIVLYF